MDPGQQLYGVIAALYISDCLWWLPRNALLLGRRRLRAIEGLFSNANGGAMFLPLIPGIDRPSELRPPPFAWDDDGIIAWVSSAPGPLGRPAQAPIALAWSDLSSITHHGSWIHVNDKAFADAGATHAAAAWADHLRALREAPAAQRASLEDRYWKASMNPDALRERLNLARRLALPSLSAGWVHLFGLFVMPPLLCQRFGLDHGLLRSALLLFASTLLNVSLYLRAHTRLYPASRRDRWKQALTMLVSFPMAARGFDALLRPLFLHLPSPAPALLLPDPAHSPELRAWARDALHPLSLDELNPAQRLRVERDHTRRLALWKSTFADQGLTELLAPLPPDLHPDEQGYCPRCEAAYLQADGPCNHCPGVNLFPKTAPPHAS